jgi:moderate conductance mechanosensitive channel
MWTRPLELIREAGQPDPRRRAAEPTACKARWTVFGVDSMDLNGVTVLTAQFRTMSRCGQYARSARAFNERLKKLVDKCDEVHFAQTYPQQVLLAPISGFTPPQPAEAAAHRSTLVLTDAPPSSQ